jgi:hypothetical protein
MGDISVDQAVLMIGGCKQLQTICLEAYARIVNDHILTRMSQEIHP